MKRKTKQWLTLKTQENLIYTFYQRDALIFNSDRDDKMKTHIIAHIFLQRHKKLKYNQPENFKKQKEES